MNKPVTHSRNDIDTMIRKISDKIGSRALGLSIMASSPIIKGFSSEGNLTESAHEPNSGLRSGARTIILPQIIGTVITRNSTKRCSAFIIFLMGAPRSNYELPTDSARRTPRQNEDFLPDDVEAGSFIARSISGHELTTAAGNFRKLKQESSPSVLYSPRNMSNSIWDSIYDSAHAFGKSVQDTYSQYFRDPSSDNEPASSPGLLQPQNEIGFSFSPAGLLLPYHLGVMRYLCDYGIINETVSTLSAVSDVFS